MQHHLSALFSPRQALACLASAILCFGCAHGAAGVSDAGRDSGEDVSNSAQEQGPVEIQNAADGDTAAENAQDSGAGAEGLEGAQTEGNSEADARNGDEQKRRRARLAHLMSREGVLELEHQGLIEDGLEEEEDLGDEAEEAANAETCQAPEDAEDADENAAATADSSGVSESPENTSDPTHAVRPGVRYTADISDEELIKMWKETPEKLGSLSIGLTSMGRLVNGLAFPDDNDAWKVVRPERTFGTQETIAYVMAAIAEVTRQMPGGSVLRINDIGLKNGGFLRPHQSHQAGRDIDISFYYGPEGPDRGPWAVAHNFDLERNWALIKAFITETDVQMILVDKSIIKKLRKFAEKKGEDKAWLDSLFNAGHRSLIRHARGHRDHFHVRFYNPRAQELGRRILPLIPKDPRQNIRYHKVCKGDTLGKIAATFGSTVKTIQKANNLKGTTIRIGQTLAVPLRGPCVHCPLPPEIIVPPRRLPPAPPAPLVSQAPGAPEQIAPDSPASASAETAAGSDLAALISPNLITPWQTAETAGEPGFQL